MVRAHDKVKQEQKDLPDGRAALFDFINPTF